MKKRLTVAKTHKKLDKLNEMLSSTNDNMKELRTLSVRGKRLGDMDMNYILYNIATFKLMIQEAKDMYPEDSPVRDQFLKDSVGENISEKVDKMRYYIALCYEREDINARIYKLENHLNALPQEEKDEYRLIKTTSELDERDLVDDEA